MHVIGWAGLSSVNMLWSTAGPMHLQPESINTINNKTVNKIVADEMDFPTMHNNTHVTISTPADNDRT